MQSFEQIAELLLLTANTEKQLLSFTVHMLRNLTTSSTGQTMRVGYLSEVLMKGKCSASSASYSGSSLKNRAFPLFVFLLEESLKLIALADLQELRLKQ